MLPENAHELCTNKLFISLTRYSDFKNVVVSEFETREELIQVRNDKNIYFMTFHFRRFSAVRLFRSIVVGNLQNIVELNTVTEVFQIISQYMTITLLLFLRFLENRIYVRMIRIVLAC
jgi:hypothetical protein